ncbi:molybdopterin-dependent oxidoreductase [uncultured Senegalimassilia sp.]|uniref:molybdopterin-containing oxidoreductase family protein n=1 Tax=uncultured Senegalimassilia sp. TaxID=1714350 RepID=UPI0026001166|nr:molybdopterin-dependent oxidoreductase [uncultured Senegalimassilia sp.]
MPKETSSSGTLTRRGFLKTTALMAGAVSVGASATCTLTALAEDSNASQKTDSSDQVYRCVCRPNCQGTCSMNVHVRDGHVVKTSMHPVDNAPEYNRICLRGLAHPYRIADSNRLKYPMRRVEGTPRGGDQWERISWSEAIDEITTKWKEIIDEYGPQAITWWKASGNYGNLGHSMYTLLFNGMNASNMTYDVDLANTMGINRVMGNAGNWVMNDVADMPNAKHVWLWGNNTTEAQIHDWHFVADAKEAGAKLVVIDPTYTKVASKADIWVPIRPGTDAVLTFGIMYVLIEEGLTNVPFMKEHTCAPFLVRSDNAKFLRMSDFGVEPVYTGMSKPTRDQWSGVMSEAAPQYDDPAAVLNAKGEVVSANDESDPLLSGTYDFNGVKCRTAYDLLLEEVKQWTPEKAEEVCGVSADTIRELAHLAADGPNYHRVGFGSNMYYNGVHSAHAGAAMTALTGQIGYKGAGYGVPFIGGVGIFDSNQSYVAGASTSPIMDVLTAREVCRTGKYKGKDHKIKAAYIYQWNPLCTSVHTNELKHDLMDNLDLIVTADTTYNDTVRYSDIVLPVCHWFEFEDIINSSTWRHVMYSEKAVEPPFECKKDSDIARLLAEKMGLGQYFTQSDEEFLRASLNTDAARKLGVTFDSLKENGVMRYDPEGTYPNIPWKDLKFKTTSKRMEFYVENPTMRLQQGQEFDPSTEHLPHFIPPKEAWQDDSNELYKKYPLILMSERPRFRVHSQFFGNELLRELDPEPTVKMNQIDADAREIKTGDYVECYNDRGHCVAKVVINNGIRPGTLVYPKSWQANQHKAGSWSELASSDFDPVAVNQNYFDNLCEMRKWEE